MSDHPILFSGPMVRALLDGRKTETRRVLKPQPKIHASGDCSYHGHRGPTDYLMRDITPRFWVKWRRGDRLWVRESFAQVGDNEDDIHACPNLLIHAYYRADSVAPEHLRWRPSIHMPREFSRITLLVHEARVERLQEITSAHAIQEGFQPYANSQTIDCDTANPRDVFARLWNHLHGPGAWDANPFVTVTRFEVVLGNIDKVEMPDAA